MSAKQKSLWVMKFGGTSVATPARLTEVLQLVKAKQTKHRVALVLSAFGGVTDKLLHLVQLAANGEDAYRQGAKELEALHLDMIKKTIGVKKRTPVMAHTKVLFNELEDILFGIYLLKDASKRARDLVVSFGERLSCTIAAGALKDKRVNARFADARCVFTTLGQDQEGIPLIDLPKSRKNLNKLTKEFRGALPVITGFLASDPQGHTVTLGRSGSDYTATLWALLAGAKGVDIWTDVDGVMSADPRKVHNAFSLKQISYEEAMELSHFGAKVLHPKTMAPLVQKQTPLYIKNTLNPKHPGTLITGQTGQTDRMVKAVTSMSNMALINVQGAGMMGVPGVARRVFGALAEDHINVVMIAQASSEHSICFAVTQDQAKAAQKCLNREFALEQKAGLLGKTEIVPRMAVVAVVGEVMQGTHGLAGQVFSALGNNGINVSAIAQGSSERNLTFIVSGTQEEKALQVIHDAFFFNKTQVHLFLVGPGVVGGKLLDQLENQIPQLAKKGVEISVHAIANSKKMLLSKSGIHLKDWKKKLSRSTRKSNLSGLFEFAQGLNLNNCILVDCTSAEKMVSQYLPVLNKKMSIVTPNKKALSGSYLQYQDILQSVHENKVKFFYETNVCAGLPVIKTIQELILSGDEVIKIEGIFSGTLSYLFNEFETGTSFCEFVRGAQQAGYTEPDPRDDLSGMDVARKLLILAREIGLTLELRNIKVENLIPKNCRSLKSLDKFYAAFAKHDKAINKRISDAATKGKVLRYVAKIERGKATVGLTPYPKDHPFGLMRGTDNKIIITTKRYKKETPLIVQGPGAGDDVTASGVFADILRVAHHF